MVSQSSPPQIPVIVLAGFLGSGKTTLLNHLLHRGGGSRIGAVVNDFGAIEIDAMAVAGALGDSTVSLGNGCLCCAVDVGELDQYMDRLAQPSARIDVIVIEASGLAEPQELVRMVLASELPGIVYGGLVEVVDAAEFAGTREKHPEIDRHLALADLVVVNKIDRADDAGRVLAVVRELAAAPRSSPPPTAGSIRSSSSTAGPARSASGSCPSTISMTMTMTASKVVRGRTVTRSPVAPAICTPPMRLCPSAPKCRWIHGG